MTPHIIQRATNAAVRGLYNTTLYTTSAFNQDRDLQAQTYVLCCAHRTRRSYYTHPQMESSEAGDHETQNAVEDREPPPVAVEDPPPPPIDNALPTDANQPFGGPMYVGTGWSAMSKIVREVDEQKIQDYKEDIDTILVFVRLKCPICV